MFRKPFTVKNNTNMRNSDRRKLLSRLPGVDSAVGKAQGALVRVISATGVPISVYAFDKCPLLFELDGEAIVYPTVYLTWLAPELFPTLYVHEDVFRFLENGADLMLPGVIRQRGVFPEFGKNSPVAVSVITRSEQVKGPLAVGLALMSSMEMIACGMQGRGVQILHLFRDTLWEFGSRAPPPQSSAARVPGAIVKPLTQEDFPPLGASTDAAAQTAESKKVGESSEGQNQIERVTDGPAGDEQLEGEAIAERNPEGGEDASAAAAVEDSMEDLLLRCFLAALKYRLTTKGTLPLDVGEFYARYLLKCVPPSRRIDMKKTVYKKFSEFLSYVNKLEGGPLVKITAKAKGSEMIDEINWSHRLLVGFEVRDELIDDGKEVVSKSRIRVEEYFALTEPLVPLFQAAAGLSKGALVDAAQARHIITDYVKSRNLNEKEKVSLRDDVLRKVARHNDALIDWNTLMQRALSQMTKTYVIVTPDGREFIRKLDLPKITFKVETRSGNKKVTLVHNLGVFGIDLKPLCHQIQVGVATSATTASDASSDAPYLVVQGNQVHFVSELLCTEYGVEKKFMLGLDLIPKKKK